MSYQSEAPGNWGYVLDTDTIKTGTETLVMSDGCKLFLRSWKTEGEDVLLILHGLGAHSGWFIDMGHELASHGLNVYAMDHRGFGRSEGHPGHVDNYQTYIEDLAFVVAEVRKRHPNARFYMLGHSMGGIFAAHFAARHKEMLNGILFLNPWIEDSAHVPLSTVLMIFVSGMLKSRRTWQGAGSHEFMTTNPEAIRMLEEDPYWCRALTMTFLVQILRMRLAVLKKARQITLPALVMQAEEDKLVIANATRKFYDTLASRDKTWISYPDYCHDTEMEEDRSKIDNDIANWIKEQASRS